MRKTLITIVLFALPQQWAFANSWQPQSTIDPMTDIPEKWLLKFSQDSNAILSLLCKEKHIFLAVEIEKIIKPEGPILIRYRFDQKEAVSARWTMASGVIFPPSQLRERDRLRDIYEHDALLFKVGINIYEFDLRGLPTAIKLFKDECKIQSNGVGESE